MSALRVRPWTSEEFNASRDTWQSLLERSGADRLFMSFDWVSAWWRHHAVELNAELYVLGIYGTNGDLAGIAPFYRHESVHRGLLRARRLELLGSAWRVPGAVFSEYLDIIASDERQDEVCQAVAGWLRADEGWDEILLCNLRDGSSALSLARNFESMGRGSTIYTRAVDPLVGWSITLPESFTAFATSLSSNTRRKVLNQREKVPGVSFRIVESRDRVEALDRLERWVGKRFGTSSTEVRGVRSRFHADVVAHWKSPGDVRVTELRVSEAPISVMLNVRAGDAEYYLMSGFDPAFATGVSPGLLHLGYAIEAACQDRIAHFDFLAGRGLHRDYKQDFATESAALRTVHLVRKPLLRGLFRTFDALRERTSHKAPAGD